MYSGSSLRSVPEMEVPLEIVEVPRRWLTCPPRAEASWSPAASRLRQLGVDVCQLRSAWGWPAGLSVSGTSVYLSTSCDNKAGLAPPTHTISLSGDAGMVDSRKRILR